ncbi:MAG TPA: carboxypeptidase-like regulatory domain-containing protein [Rubricoccaceae bacterium]|jgi:hypothetical protein
MSGCKDSPLGPELYGTISGRVVDFDSGAGLAGTNITTSPATGSIVTGADGSFEFNDVPAGTYTISARRPGYRSSTASVAVIENRVTQAAVFLQLSDSTDPDSTDAEISVEVTNFFNRTVQTSRGDSVVVVVEYRVRNTGTEPVPSYEAYFRIITPAGDFFQEVQGTSIGIGQTDLGRFEKEAGGARATAVRVDGFFIGGQKTARPRPIRH